MTTKVEHDVIGQRYRVLVDGRRVGFADYIEKEDVRVFNHTVVNPSEQGKGLAGVVMKAALDDTRKNGMLVIPACSYVRYFINKNPEYADLVAHNGA